MPSSYAAMGYAGEFKIKFNFFCSVLISNSLSTSNLYKAYKLHINASRS